MTTRLTVATYNIHKCVGLDGVHDPERTFAVLRELDADLVGIQEYDSRVRPGRGPIKLADFERSTGYRVIGCPTMSEGHAFHGNLLLSRLPLRAVAIRDISVPAHQARKLLMADVVHDGVAFRVGVSHLSPGVPAQSVQAWRLAAVGRPTDGRAFILLADANAWLPALDSASVLNRHLGRTRASRSFPTNRPLLPLDRIWASPPGRLESVNVHQSETARIASDHLPVRAVVTLETS